MATKKGRALIVTRKRQELAEFEEEIKKESESTEESKLKLEKMRGLLDNVNGKLHSFGVNMQDVDALCKFLSLF